jgi:hypothetical protein
MIIEIRRQLGMTVIALGVTASSTEAATRDWYGYDLRSTEWTPATAGTFTLDACALASEGDARLLVRRAAESTTEAAASNSGPSLDTFDFLAVLGRAIPDERARADVGGPEAGTSVVVPFGPVLATRVDDWPAPWWELDRIECPGPIAVTPESSDAARAQQASVAHAEATRSLVEMAAWWGETVSNTAVGDWKAAAIARPDETIASPAMGSSPIGITLYFEKQDALQAWTRLSGDVSRADLLVRDLIEIARRLDRHDLAATIAERVPPGTSGFASVVLHAEWPIDAMGFVASIAQLDRLRESNRRFLDGALADACREHDLPLEVCSDCERELMRVLADLPIGFDLHGRLGPEARALLKDLLRPGGNQILDGAFWLEQDGTDPFDVAASIGANVGWRLHGLAWLDRMGLLPSERARRDADLRYAAEQWQTAYAREFGIDLDPEFLVRRIGDPAKPWATFPIGRNRAVFDRILAERIAEMSAQANGPHRSGIAEALMISALDGCLARTNLKAGRRCDGNRTSRPYPHAWGYGGMGGFTLTHGEPTAVRDASLGIWVHDQ